MGDLYRSPVNASIAYVPATAGSSNVGPGDLIALSAALYSYDYLVQIFVPYPTGDVILYQATLG